MPAASQQVLLNSQAVRYAKAINGRLRISDCRRTRPRAARDAHWDRDIRVSVPSWHWVGTGRTKMRIGNRDAMTLQEARKRADEFRREVEAGRDPAREAEAHAQSPTFGDVATAWIKWKRQQKRAASYIRSSETRLAKNVLPIIGERKVRDITRSDAAGILATVGARGAPYETNRVRALLRAILHWAAGFGYIEVDPTAHLPKLFDERPRERVLRDQDVRLVWDGIANAPASEAIKIAMRLCLALGQRPQEIVRVRKDKLILEGPAPTMTIIAADSKNRHEHVLPLNALAVELFKQAAALAPSSPWVFPRPAPDGKDKGPVTSHALTRVVSRARQQGNGTPFGLSEDARLYDFKRTVATGLGDLGYPDEMIGRLVNHRGAKGSRTISKHYNHATYVRERREMLQAWDSKLREVLGLPEFGVGRVVPLARESAVVA